MSTIPSRMRLGVTFAPLQAQIPGEQMPSKIHQALGQIEDSLAFSSIHYI